MYFKQTSYFRLMQRDMIMLLTELESTGVQLGLGEIMSLYIYMSLYSLIILSLRYHGDLRGNMKV